MEEEETLPSRPGFRPHPYPARLALCLSAGIGSLFIERLPIGLGTAELRHWLRRDTRIPKRPLTRRHRIKATPVTGWPFCSLCRQRVVRPL